MDTCSILMRNRQTCFSSLKPVAVFFTDGAGRKVTAQAYQSAKPSQMMKVGDNYAGKPEYKRPFELLLKSITETT